MLCNNQKVLSDFLEIAIHSPYIILDIEGDPKKDLVLGFGLSEKHDVGIYVPINHLEEGNVPHIVLAQVFDFIKQAPCLVFHNAIYDMRQLVKLGVHLENNFIDTMILAHHVDENLMSKSLDWLCNHYGIPGKQRPKVMQDLIDNPLAGWSSVPVEMMMEYCLADCYATNGLLKTLIPLWEEQFGELFSVK